MNELDLNVLTWSCEQNGLIFVIKNYTDLGGVATRQNRNFVADFHCTAFNFTKGKYSFILHLVQNYDS